jgi:hypothetical protein
LNLTQSRAKFSFFALSAHWSSFRAKLAQKWTQKTQNRGLGTIKQPFWTAYWILYVSCSKLFFNLDSDGNFFNFKERNFLLRQKRIDWRTRNRNYLGFLVEALWIYPEDSAGGAERSVFVPTLFWRTGVFGWTVLTFFMQRSLQIYSQRNI